MSFMEPTAQFEDSWRKAEDLSLIFRGAFMQQHGRGEQAVGEALLALHTAKNGLQITLPHLAGQRAAALRKAIESLADRSPHVPSMLKLLDEFVRFERLRGFLCHGAVIPLIDHKGGWCLGMKLLDFRGSVPSRESFFLTKADAAAVLLDITTVVSRLAAALGQIKPILNDNAK